MTQSLNHLAARLRAAAVVCSAAFSVACGGSSSDADSTEEVVPLDELPAAFAEAQCSVIARCIPIYSALVGSAEECSEQVTAQVTAARFDALEQAVEDGRTTYDAAQARACADALSAVACDEIDMRSIEACEATFEGTVARGGDCTLDEECEGDSICVFSDACPGTCSGRLAAGENCTDDDRCEDGLVCSEATAKCVLPAGGGDPCGGADEPQCEFPLLCLGEDDDAGTPGVCLTQAEAFSGNEGDSCNFIGGDPSLCKEGLSCVVLGFDVDIEAQTFELIAECQSLVGSGEACGLGLPSQCPAGEFCGGVDPEAADFEGSCSPLPQAGDDCGSGLLRACAFGLTCIDGTCSEPKQNGESCASDDECLSDLCSDGGCSPTNSCQ